ncbi:MAG: hypothetical protein IJS08_02580 [Victivallales bacterium]|nr:hypothetical protein [Victivallales bacterium]
MRDVPINVLYAEGVSSLGDTVTDAVDQIFEGSQGLFHDSGIISRDLRLGVIHDLDFHFEKSRSYALLRKVCEKLPDYPRKETYLYLASTVGAIDELEKASAGEKPDCTGLLLQEARALTGIDKAVLVSAACASGQTAAAMAMRALRYGRCRYALVIGIDICSEFVTGGFASLRAYSKDLPKPYDRDRDGLCLGEGCGALLLTAEEAPDAVGQLLEAREGCDASHITAPESSGKSLASLIDETLKLTGLRPSQLSAVIGHGTGTIFNDASELAALNQVFSRPLPLVSIKGNTGHTLGATGVLQIAYGLEFLHRGYFPPQAGLQNLADGASGFVSKKVRQISKEGVLLSLNVGFGGLNSTMLMRLPVKEVQKSLPLQTELPMFEHGTAVNLDCNMRKCSGNRKLISFEDLTDLKEQLLQMAGNLQVDLADFRRAADNVRMAQLGVLLCAIAMGDEWSPENTGIIGVNGDGCAANNRAYWDDYVAHGRDSGRASLFVPTLPSIPACEAAIALGIKGPVRYVSSRLSIFEHLQNTFAAYDELRQLITVEIDNGRANIKLYKRCTSLG